MSTSSLLVISPIDPESIQIDAADGQPVLSAEEKRLDAADPYNHPRIRRALILRELLVNKKDVCDIQFKVVTTTASSSSSNEDWTELYKSVHTAGLLEFLSTAWDQWSKLGELDGQDSIAARPTDSGLLLIPIVVPLHRDACKQRPSKHVIGQIGYYATDIATPIFGDLVNELANDSAAVQAGVDAASHGQTVYVVPTHPGHHGSADSFGGYCYVNSVAAAARRFQTQHGYARVAILDVDYHAGNGTAAIFYDDPSVLVVSLHCDPDWDYPFHSGFADETGAGDAVGATLHLPMPPGTTWETYQESLQKGLQAIAQFTPGAVLVSLGLDTYDQDPCAIRRAGFKLQGDDYKSLGRFIAEQVPPRVPVMFLQEGGYRMDKIGEAAADVVTSFCQHRSVA